MKTKRGGNAVCRSLLPAVFGLWLLATGSFVRAQEAASTPANAGPAPVSVPVIGTPESKLDFQTYRLSYMQSDRVIALLKALGYATVEFSSAKGDKGADNIYTVVKEATRYPLVIKLLDASKTSLFQPPADGGSSKTAELGDTLGGTYLHQQTTGAPEQRLFILYRKAEPEQLHALIQLLRNEIDVPARQVVIEALVVEVDTKKLDEFGANYDLKREDLNLSMNVNQQGVMPFIGKFNDASNDDWKSFSAGIRAMVQDGHAEILSNPSVLVLNGRQARIQVGQQVPTSQAVATNNHVRSGVKYIQTGIVLNLRPRLSEDGSEVTMQVETIVSSVNTAESIRKTSNDAGLMLAPVVENRQVQSFVRVADNTPFIVGGLIATDKRNASSGLPFVSRIPYIGKLFKRTSKVNNKREVIVVLTPHVINTGDKSFSYVIPKDSKTFDSFDHILFRNAYRIRDDDVFDLSFATQSKYYTRILENLKAFRENHPEVSGEDPVFGYLRDKVPGEDVIVRRMIWEIVHKARYHQNISDDHILVFEANKDAGFGNKFKTLFLHNLLAGLKRADENTLVFDYADDKAKPPGPFEHPRALISRTKVRNPENYVEQISVLNSDDLSRNTILLSDSVAPPGVRGATALEVLKGVLILKRILALNPSMPVTISEFRVGRQITFPTEKELSEKYHIIDYETARYFYQIINYYPEFENAFNRDSEAIERRMQKLSGDSTE